MRRARISVQALILAAASLGGLAPALAQRDVLVQPPTLGEPERGSVAGAFSGLAVGPGDLAQGGVTLPSPFEVPDARGRLLADIFPSYSPGTGLTEWGMGWDNRLVIRRHRMIGEIDYQTDEFLSPWGALVLGDDGRWYVRGEPGGRRFHLDAAGWTVVTGDGTEYRFGLRQEASRGVYAWYLTSVTSVAGGEAQLEYLVNDSGRPFLRRVVYGRRPHADAYEVTLQYQSVSAPLASYASGDRAELDRRVTGVRVSAKHAQAGDYRLRWRYLLRHRDSLGGPAFYLASVERHYGTGEHKPLVTEPATTYRYDLPEYEGASKEVFLRSGELEPVPHLSNYLELVEDVDGLQPDRASLVDVDRDGLIDIEYSSLPAPLTVFRQQPDGSLLQEPLGAPPEGANAYCRPDESYYGTPRTLAHLRGAESDVQVVAFDAYSLLSDLIVCDRDGRELFRAEVEGYWSLDANTRLVDLNGDDRPDLVKIGFGSYEVLENVSGDGCAEGEAGPCVPYGFVSHPARELSFLDWRWESAVTWVHDLNGDGRADLVQRYAEGVSVWFGRGQFEFDTEVRFPFVNRDGYELHDLSMFGLTWMDANRDGLVDALLTYYDEALLFLNDGSSFREVRVEVLEEAWYQGWNLSSPVVADFRASGNAELLYTSGSDAWSVALNEPSTGLLRELDDGKGTVISLSYARAPAAPRLGHRPAVLAEMTVASGGYDAVTFLYDYEAPVVHSRTGSLIGYRVVTKLAPVTAETVTFHHDDEVSGIVLERVRTDARTPDLFERTTMTYEDRTFRGVRWLRPASTTRGYVALDGSEQLLQTTEYTVYERELCAVGIRTNSEHGILETSYQLASPALLDDALHCLHGREVVSGFHPEASRNFILEQQVLRRADGQVASVIQHGEAGPLVVQALAYDGNGRLVTVSAPGRGTATIEYDPSTGLVAAVTAPDGVVTRVQAADPVTDAPRELLTDRGPGGELVAAFSYDHLERLVRAWDSVGGSSAKVPRTELGYRFPSATRPGIVSERALVDAAGPNGPVYRQAAAFSSADGEAIAEATLIPEGWATSGVSETRRNELRTIVSRRDPLAAKELYTVTWEALRSGAVIHEATATGFGPALAEWAVIQTGVTREFDYEIELRDRALVTKAVENPNGSSEEGSSAVGPYTTEVHRDLDGRAVLRIDELGAATTYGYDALGRLVEVTLPDGQVQAVSFDAYGRPASVHRPGIGTIAYGYTPETGLLATKHFYGRTGLLERTVAFAYDEVGRVIEQRHESAADGATRSFAFEFDGGEAPLISGQRGRLTRVVGDRHRETTRYRADGALVERRVTIDGWREVAYESTFYPSGDPRSITRTLRDAGSGAILETQTRGYEYDAWGRLAEMTIEGETLVSLHYDAHGNLARVELPDGQAVSYAHDPVTQRLRGIWQSGAGWSAGVQWSLDARGLVASESVHHGDETTERRYAYDPRGFLGAVSGDGPPASYDYSAAGLPTWADDERGGRDLERFNGSIWVGDEEYVYDALGRLASKGDLALSYGPDGHLVRATRGDTTWSYYYTQAGERLLKERDGIIVAAYVDGAYLTDDGFITPVRVGGRLLGVLDGSQFHLVATDARGTVLADRDGVPRLPTPFGVRSERPDLAPALDYAEKGFDADVGMVRMGARDYDPLIGQFTTPDPLFFESIEKCAGDATSCNLYSYALNNPLNFVDPTGLEPDPVKELLQPPKPSQAPVVGHPATGPATTIGGFIVSGPIGTGIGVFITLGESMNYLARVAEDLNPSRMTSIHQRAQEQLREVTVELSFTIGNATGRMENRLEREQCSGQCEIRLTQVARAAQVDAIDHASKVLSLWQAYSEQLAREHQPYAPGGFVRPADREALDILTKSFARAMEAVHMITNSPHSYEVVSGERAR